MAEIGRFCSALGKAALILQVKILSWKVKPAPYSNDLRKKAVEAYARGEGSQAAIAKRFSISLSSFKSYWKRYEKTGSANFIIGNKGRPSSIRGKTSEERLLKLVSKHPDATLSE